MAKIHYPGEEALEPMQLGRACVSEEECQRRVQQQLCYNCGKLGHRIYHCPEKPTMSQVGISKTMSKIMLPAFLLYSNVHFPVTALIDSGSAVNLIDRKFVHELKLPAIPCTPPLRVTAINDQLIGEGLLTHQIPVLDLQIGLFHHEKLSFISSPSNPIVLGLPWLRLHNPCISWKEGEFKKLVDALYQHLFF